MRRSARLAAALCVLAGVSGGLEARAQGSHWEFWPEADVFVGLTPATRFLGVASLTQARDTSYRQAEIGAYLDDRVVTHLSLRGGYSFLGALANHKPDEHRLVAALTATADLPAGLTIGDRNRFDWRWIGGDFSWRYRNRLRLERPVGAITPYGMVEVYYDFTRATVSRVESTIGVAWDLSRRVSIEGGFAHQDSRSPSTDNVNAILFTTTLSF